MSRITNMARFTEEPPMLRHIGESEQPEPVSILKPMLDQLAELQPLPVVIGVFNAVFERLFEPRATYSRFTLENMAFWAGDQNYPWLQQQLLKHAKNATTEI